MQILDPKYPTYQSEVTIHTRTGRQTIEIEWELDPAGMPAGKPGQESQTESHIQIVRVLSTEDGNIQFLEGDQEDDALDQLWNEIQQQS